MASEIEELLEDGSFGTGRKKPIVESDLPKGFSRIPHLKPGDRLRYKNNRYRSTKVPSAKEVVTVHRVGDFSNNVPSSDIDVDDFTVLFDDDTDEDAIKELPLDSRRFERVE